MLATTALRAMAVLLLAGTLSACGEESVSSPPAAPPAYSPAAAATPAAAEPGSTGPSARATTDVVSAIAAAARAASGSGSVERGAPAAQQTASAQRLAPASHLKIPEIGVDAPLVPLGVDANGEMQVPGNGTDVGWYTFSAVPGEAGNAVLSGHVDTTTSTTAVFTRLKSLKIGDPMSVVIGGRQVNYQVFWTRAWMDDQAPLPLILGNAPSPTLTLITCAGTFNRTDKNYSERLVVRAKLPGSV